MNQKGGRPVAQDKTYIAIDLKSFYASQECVERGLDPMTVNLVVADASRTEKTICLAVSPALKAFGIPGRARLFEVLQKVQAINAQRRDNAPGHTLTGSSCNSVELRENPALALDFIIAPPQMARYMECSAKIYEIYLQYVAPEDIHVYSIDEVFLDATPYLQLYGLDGRSFAKQLIQTVFDATGITATAGIGTNLYLSKIAMDIMAKRIPPDEDGVRIAELDEMSYRRELWSHRPLTDFWRVGHGYAKKLETCGLFTMGDIARCSLGKPSSFYSEDLLYKLFGVNAELLIDHAWGWEPCTIADIKAYRPESNSIGSGQVLQCPYPYDKSRLIVREMTDLLVLDLVDKGLLTDQMVLSIGFDRESLNDPEIRKKYAGPVTKDFYGRKIPKHANGSVNLPNLTSSTKQITEAVMGLFERIVDPNLLVRRVNVTATRVIPESALSQGCVMEQLDLFADTETERQRKEAMDRERRRQEAVLHIRKKYGKNAILKGMNLEEGATTMDRNNQIGGHKA